MSPNKGYLLEPPYGQSNYVNENYPGSFQTHVTGLNNSGDTSGFWANKANGDNGVAVGFYNDAKGHSHAYEVREHHPRFLPPAFWDFRVESGGVGADTVTRFKVTAGGRTREYHTVVAEPEPGRILTESDTGSSAVTTFTVSPQAAASLVRISTTWKGAGGIGGLFERMFAPRVLRAIYADELRRLDAYARQQSSA